MDGWQWRILTPTAYHDARRVFYMKNKANGPIILQFNGMNSVPLFHIILEASGSPDQWG